MSIFLYILTHNIIPIFILISLGFLLSKKFNLHIQSFSKFLFYLFTPAFVFTSVYTTQLHFDMAKVIAFGLVMLMANNLVGAVVAKIRKYDTGLTNAFKNSIMFNNSANVGVSLITLIFSSFPFIVDGKTPYLNEAITAQIMILVVQSISVNTLGFFNAGQASKSRKDSLIQVFKMPAIYVIPIAFMLQWQHIDITATPIWPALNYLKNGLVPMALLTLGVQLAKTTFNFKNPEVHLSVFLKLFIGPVLALLFIYIFKFEGVIAQTVFIAHSVPTAVNTALIAVECNSYPDFASQAVMISTILSAITLTAAIYAARIMFPV